LHFGSNVGFGTSGTGMMNQHVSEQLAEAILERAYAAGIRNFDTAPFYGHGLSELRLGRFLRRRERRSFTVSTEQTPVATAESERPAFRTGIRNSPPRGQPASNR
jgi:D-threo-aldose 1-dehydrogenase